MRLTNALVQVALALMTDQLGQHWGYELSRTSGVRSGVMYPVLSRMLEHGWLTDGWETATDATGRRPRRYYELTEIGRRELGAILDHAPQDPRFASLFRFA